MIDRFEYGILHLPHEASRDTRFGALKSALEMADDLAALIVSDGAYHNDCKPEARALLVAATAYLNAHAKRGFNP